MKGRVARLVRAVFKQRALVALVLLGYVVAMVGSISVVTTEKANAGSISTIASQSAALDTTQSLVISKPSGTIAGDVLVASVFVNDQNDGLTSSGWTTEINTNAGNRRLHTMYLVAGSSEPSTYTFSTTGGTNRNLAGGITTYRGVDNSDPTDSSGGGTNGNTASPQALNTPTTTTNTVKVVVSFGMNANVTFTPPTSSSTYAAKERFDVSSGSVSVMAADYIIPTSGSNFGTETATASASGNWVAHQVGLKPDSQVHMLLFWDSASAPPAGWSVIDDFDGLFPRGESVSNFAGTGGSATHTPSPNTSTVGYNATTPLGNLNNSTLVSLTTHTHPAPSVSVTAVSNIPAYCNLKLIRNDTGIPNIIPTGAIAIFDGTPAPPAGWSQPTNRQGKFIRIGSGVSSCATPDDSSTDTHNTTVTWNGGSGTLAGASGSGQRNSSTFLGSTTGAVDGHTHSLATSTNSPGNATLPLHMQPIIAKADSDTPTISIGLTAMFDGDPGGGWVLRSSSGEDFYQRLMRPAATYNGASAGSATTTDSTTQVTTGTASAGATVNSLLATQVANITHTHTVEVTFNAVTNTPPYFNIVVAEKVNFILSNYWWYIDNGLLTPTNAWGNPDLAEDTPIIVLPIASMDPPRLGDDLRLRLQILINGNDLAASAVTFKLQYNATRSENCTTDSGTWVDIGDNSDTDKPWRYTDSTAVTASDSTPLAAFPGGRVPFSDVSTIPQLYMRGTSPGSNPNGATIGNRIEYDLHIQNYAADGATQYSFRLLETNGTLLSQYGEGSESICPTLTTMPSTENQMRHGNFFETDPNAEGTGSLEGGFSWVD